MAKTLLPKEFGDFLVTKLKQNADFDAAMQLIHNEQRIVQEYQEYYQSIFTKDIFNLCEELRIEIPT